MLAYLVILISVHLATSQVPARTYNCVPIGSCRTRNTTTIIDPRITTPSEGLCPTGSEPCPITPTPVCGLRAINDVSLVSGPSSYGAHPWIAYIITRSGAFLGTGVLVNQQIVLTAAHKVYMVANNPTNVVVILGLWTLLDRNGTQSIPASEIIVYPTFSNTTLKNDLAIIRLSSLVVFQSNIRQICLPNAGESFVDRTCMVAGWGENVFGASNAPLPYQKQVVLQIVNIQQCFQSMSRPDVLGSFASAFLDTTGGEICAGGAQQVDACTQDGGSPLVCIDAASQQYFVAGLVIWGKRCGLPGVYGVYVSIPFYMEWILRYV